MCAAHTRTPIIHMVRQAQMRGVVEKDESNVTRLAVVMSCGTSVILRAIPKSQICNVNDLRHDPVNM